ncbi:hypothetical protein Sme01_22620 [Sphaerisporangium melleum]|uniref:Uncharacterized protein n=1 Tax=Sphaerisporangium melleum TaxID=321316 RepID=A0A917VGL5_9ACTN|nr:hypothetical protein GCM10007964_21750 [Sphaerisporangium melleum]GII69786.1 hypothetical protein Sme01_22620 [Sphaerisporangium melleum]
MPEPVGRDDAERLAEREYLGHLVIFQIGRHADPPPMAESMAETDIAYNEMAGFGVGRREPAWPATARDMVRSRRMRRSWPGRTP